MRTTSQVYLVDLLGPRHGVDSGVGSNFEEVAQPPMTYVTW